MRNIITRLVALMQGQPADQPPDQTAQIAALKDKVRAKSQALDKVTAQRDMIKPQLPRLRAQNEKLQVRVPTFISDYFIFLIEKMNRLDRLMFDYADIDQIAQCDLVVAHHFDSLQTALALKAASGRRIKVLFDCVEHPVHNLRTPGKLAYYFQENPVRDVAHQVLNDDMIRQYDGIIYTSPGHGPYLEALGVPAQLVYNTRELGAQSASDRSLRTDTGAGPDDHVVLFLNHVYPRGGFDTFMDMAGALRSGYKFGFLDILRDIAWDAKFADLSQGAYADRLIHLDMERPNRVVDYIRQADCVLCSFDASHEGYAGLLPIRFFDALMASVPIVAPATSQAGEIVAHYQIGVVYQDGGHLAAVREACEMKKTGSFQAHSAVAQATFGWDAAP